MAKISELELLQDNVSEDIMAVIYDKINELFGAGNQLFTMEFPARVLNSKTYEYDTSDCYSALTKPYPVQEAEFALSNQLFDPSPMVQGPNGEKLSTVYTTVLNNYVPKLQALEGFVSDQKNLRQWLLTKINDEVEGKDRTVSRMGLSKELYAEFLTQRNEWYDEKNKEYDKRKTENDLDGYARWLSTKGLVEEEKINNLYNDAVVRGNYHEVLTLLGFLNVSSPAEVLEDTKQKIRASLRRSLDGSSDVYPVQFQPSDWFKALRPNINPKDLTMAIESLMADYKAKKERLAFLQAQFTEMDYMEVSPEKQKETERKIKECESKLNTAEQNLIHTYGKGAVEATKAAISIYKTINPVMKATDIVKDIADSTKKSETKINVVNLIGDIAPTAMAAVADTYDKQSEVLRQHKELTDLQMSYTESKVKERQLQKLRLQEQIKLVQSDLDFLTPLVTGVIAEEGKKELSKENTNEKEEPQGEGVPKEEPLMTGSEGESDDENFMDVIIKCDEQGSFTSNNSSASAQSGSWGVGGWFWSGKRSKSESSAINEDEKKSLNKKIEIGFRAKKVTFERGGWFNPNIFKLSNNYYRLADIRCNGGMTKKAIQNATSDEELKSLKSYQLDNDSSDIDYVLPAFPTGFIIAKDITIRIAVKEETIKLNKEYMQKNESGGGGIFGFRGNTSKSSSSSSETAYFGSTDNFFYIRIPGPQILGWFLEFTAADNSTPYERLNENMYSGVLKALIHTEDDKVNTGRDDNSTN